MDLDVSVSYAHWLRKVLNSFPGVSAFVTARASVAASIAIGTVTRATAAISRVLSIACQFPETPNAIDLSTIEVMLKHETPNLSAIGRIGSKQFHSYPPHLIRPFC